MPSEGLAKMAAAQLMCKALFDRRELDTNLNPVGKESLKYAEPDMEISDDEEEFVANPVPREERPRAGTTKRRQYYYKKVCTPLQLQEDLLINYRFCFQRYRMCSKIAVLTRRSR